MNDVTYWILMLLLTAGCAGLLAGSFASVKRRNAQRAALRRRGRRPSGRGNGSGGQGPVPGGSAGRGPEQGQQGAAPEKKKKRQWKIILEDIDSWEKYSFVFYDAVGIGREREGRMYEKYLSIPDDKRVSKSHCVILRRGDQLYLKDEGSRNGTYLNGQMIEGPELLQKDDVIGIGGVHLEVQRILRESD